MSPGSAWAWGALVVGTALMGACRREERLSPPRVYLGEDVCHVCGMIISDDRFIAAIVEIRDGRVNALLFDDVGEALEFSGEPAERSQFYVRDVESREWLDARDAVFVRSETLITPMATGVAACEDRASALRLLAEGAGEIWTLGARHERIPLPGNP